MPTIDDVISMCNELKSLQLLLPLNDIDIINLNDFYLIVLEAI